MWQALHEELESQGVTVVTVALDVNADDAKPWIEAAAPTHPALIDKSHVTDQLFGFDNVPMAVWIDEAGTIVRPAEQAAIQESGALPDLPDEAPERLKRTFAELKLFRSNATGYLAAIHDWAANGSASEFALSESEVINRSGGRSREDAEAAACFELGQWHWERGEQEAAVPWWREAHRLQPGNWTYKRQAWTFVTTQEGQPPDLLQGPNDVYEGNWLDDLIAQGGGATYYTPPEL